MSYERIIKTQVENIWIRFVFQKFVYRGMDKSDLIFPLDPKKNPFEPYKAEIQKFFHIVDKICEHKINNHQNIITLLPNETEEFFCSICRPISEQEISKIEIVKG